MKGTFHKALSLSIGIITLTVVSSSFAQVEGEYQIQPLYTRYAETAKKITFNATGRIFNDVQMQEADNFDGWTVDADLTIPIPGTKRLQLRVFWPFYTEGEGRLIDPGHADTGQKIDISGYGGVFDFPSALLEYQFLSETEDHFNAAFFLGAGKEFRVLETSTFSHDVYNHAGYEAIFGLKGDWRFGEEWRFLANLGGRYYWVSDDLNPEGTGSDDVFALADISLAAIYHPWKFPVFPVAEMVYQGNFSGYNSVLFVPEAIWAINTHFELKAGVPIGLTSDGQSFGGTFQATVRF